MQPSEVEIPRSIMDPAPPPKQPPKHHKKTILIVALVVVVLIIAGVAAWALLQNSNQSGDAVTDQSLTPTLQPTPTPSLKDTSTVKQVAVDGRTFTHIVPKDWRTAQSDGDLVSSPFEVPASSGVEPWVATAAIRYNQGVYALKTPTPTNPICDVIVADSESVQVSPNDERFINYCGKKVGTETIFTYVLFSKFSYKQGRSLSAAEQADLAQNALLFGRIIPAEDEATGASYTTLLEATTFDHLIEIFRSITYVQTQ